MLNDDTLFYIREYLYDYELTGTGSRMTALWMQSNFSEILEDF